MINQDHAIAAGTAGSAAITLASALGDSPDWRIVALNAGFTLLSGLIASWLKSRGQKGGK